MHGQDHLHAICARAEIPEPLSAILLKRGGQSVIDRLALTPGAQFSRGRLRRLLRRASADERRRVNVHQRAMIETSRGSPIMDCTILNTSPTGAFLKLDTAINVSEPFAVIFCAIEHRRVPCRLAWKTDAGIGIAFEADPFGAQAAA